MNDGWNPIEDLEPLDHNSLGLLAAYRGAAGPSQDAEARMLAGLRARLETQTQTHTRRTRDEDAVSGGSSEATPAPHRRRAASNARTLTVAAVAFAAGVALTVALHQTNAPDSPISAAGDDAPLIVRRNPQAVPEPVRPEAYSLYERPTASEVSTPEGLEPIAERSWPMSIADLVKPPDHPESGQEGPSQDPATLNVDPTKPGEPSETADPTTPRRRSDEGSRGRDRMEGATAPSSGPAPAVDGRGGPLQGAWAPSVSAAPSGAGIGSAARNPSAAGPPPNNGNNGNSGSSNTGGDGSGDKASSADKEPSASPSDNPPDEPQEPEESEQPEQPLEERCTEELDDCLVDADAFCVFGYPGCESVHEFCFMRSMTCLGADAGIPDPQFPPDEPEPDDCDTGYGICVMEADATCVVEKLGPLECEQQFFACEEFLAMCYGDPPPEPPPW